MNRKTIAELLSSGKITPERAAQYLTALDLCSTHTDQQVAAFTGLTTRQVEHLRSKLGMRKYTRWSIAKVRRCLSERRRGYTWAEVAERMGVPRTSAQRAAERYGHLTA